MTVAVAALYEALIDGWNNKNGEAFAAPFAEDGAVIGFDGSEQRGRGKIEAEMQGIFNDHLRDEGEEHRAAEP
jgi:uncharacterized protein (TIGR02246 family)